MPTGSALVKAIDILLDEALHDAQKARDRAAEASASALLRQYDIAPTSMRLATTLKQIRSTDDSDGSGKRLEIFRNRFPHLVWVSDADMQTLIRELIGTLGPIDNILFLERTRLSTISTVLRPLLSKWIERWKSQRNDFDYLDAVNQVRSLLNRQVENERQLKIWLQDVFDVFVSLVVFRPDTIRKLDSVKQRPSGMVGAGNERLYRRNWDEFCRVYSSKMIDKATNLENDPLGESIRNQFSDALTSQNFRLESANPNLRQDASLRGHAQSEVEVNLGKIKIDIQSTVSNQGVASRTWNSMDSLKGELPSFIKQITTAWGQSASNVNVTVSMETPSGMSVIPISDKPATEVAGIVLTLLEIDTTDLEK